MPASDRLRSALADRYSIERELGSGGMATVYLARDLKHDREVALKVLRADLSAVIGSERFLSEVRIAAKLDHPHILTLIDSGSADGILYYVLPYVRGESLRVKLDREKQLSVQDALSITTQVASALDYAHAQGVVHRDIKPENILLHEGEAMLADFGIALAVKVAGGNRLTETGLSLGTPLYMSPEQATGDRSLDRRSDVYSLAAVFYEMIAGEPPVTGPNAQAIIAKLLTEKPVKLRVVRETIPLAMEQATEKALAKTPADRFASAGDFARALAVAAPERAGPERATSSSRSRMKLAAIAVAAVALIGLGLWLTRGKINAPVRTAVTLRDRTQVTNTGRVSMPDISDDGKVIAYIVTDCGPRGCRYGIEMQDIDGGSSRRLLEGATAMDWVQVSPDRRNVLFRGSINHVNRGMFLLSTLGGSPRQLANVLSADFWAGGDSLLLIRPSAIVPADTLWILVSGLDGVPTDSIRVDAHAAALGNYTVVPNSHRIIYMIANDGGEEWISSDRSGKRYSSMRFPGVGTGGFASSDALWIAVPGPGATSIIRIPFDATTGRLAQHGDTVYRGRFSAFSVTADGGTLLLDEGITEFAGWALSFDDLLKGRFTEDKRVLRSTRPINLNMSPDGNAMVLWREEEGRYYDGRAADQMGEKITVMPFGGGAEVALPGRHQSAWLEDSTTLGILDKTTSGGRLSLVDYRTQKRSGVLVLPAGTFTDNMAPNNTIRLRGTMAGWAWALDGRTLNVQRDGETVPKKIRLPSWHRWPSAWSASQDGGTLAFSGYNASYDSIGIGLLSLSDGNSTHVWTTAGEYASLRWLQDGSLLIIIFDTLESATLYRARIGGPIERLGSVPRPVSRVRVSKDLQRAVVSTRDYRGDAWMSKVVR